MRWWIKNWRVLACTLVVCGLSAAPARAEYGTALRPSGFDGNVVYRTAIQQPGNTTNYLVVGRAWTGSQYEGLVASQLFTGGWPNGSFTRRNGWIPGVQFFDFAGAGFDNLCNGGVYAYDGYIVACRSMKSNGYYDIYLAKFSATGSLMTAFDTDGIVASGVGGNSTDGHAFIRGIAYNPDVNTSHHGVVTIVGSIGTNGTNYRPFIAAYDQQTGAAYGSIVKNTAYVGTAVGVAYDSTAGAYFVASTENSGTRHFYVDKYSHNSGTPTIMDTASSPFGTALSFSGAGGGNESIPSAITVSGTKVFTVGANRSNNPSTTPWVCAVAAISTTTGSLSSGYGYVGISGGSSDTGITLFSHNGSTPSQDCLLNSITPSGTDIVVTGTAYTGSNYDYLSAAFNSSGDFDTAYNSTGMKVMADGPADDVMNWAFVSGSDVYLSGRSQDNNYYSGGSMEKVSLTGTATPYVTSIDLSPSSGSIVGNRTVTFTATATYSDASTSVVPAGSLDWSSSNAGISVTAGAATASSAVTSTVSGAIGSVIGTYSISSSAESAPPNPSSFAVSVYGTTSLTFTWASGGGTTAGYKLAQTSGGTAPSNCNSGTDLGNVLTTTVSSLTNAATYSFRLCAYNRNFTPDVSSGQTLTDSPAIPLAPSGLGATAISTSRIDLSWTDNSSNESGFYIERSTDGSSYSQITSVAANSNSYSNTSLSDGTLYYYRVRAYNATGNSSYTSVASATTQTIPLTLTSISPSLGGTGHTLSLVGTGFNGSMTVSVNGSSCSSVSASSSSAATCTAPTPTGGAGDVSVTYNGTTQTLTNGYHYMPSALVDGNGTNGV
ncbi:fibronectin type III domain-containing protein, partial [bacterium]|nr:fibronectin type III domain-containing protein [bacterium]